MCDATLMNVMSWRIVELHMSAHDSRCLRRPADGVVGPHIDPNLDSSGFAGEVPCSKDGSDVLQLRFNCCMALWRHLLPT